MSKQDQCPSTTKGESAAPSKAELAASPRRLSTIAGKRAWRSLDEYADSGEFRDFLEREFPAGASELLQSSRRGFMQLMGASLALAGAAVLPGCRRPDHRILTYSKNVPEEIIPGKPLFYATAMPLPGGGAEGLIVETHEGRPTKVEGNPLHPVNQGRSSIWAQASVLDLYDPDRLKYPTFFNPARGRLEATLEDFKGWWAEHGKKIDAAKGKGVAIIVDKKSSPTRDRLKRALVGPQGKWPEAAWVAYDGCENGAALEGGRIAFGRPVREQLSLVHAKVVVSLDRDFLNNAGGAVEPFALAHAREFAAARKVNTTRDGMNRLYVVESGMSITGAQADHRLRLAPSRIAAFALALAGKLGVGGAGAASDVDQKFLDAVADDLSANKGACVVVAGPTLPAEIHALVHAINAALGNVGKTVTYRALGEDEGANSAAGLGALAARMDRGEIETLIVLHANPVYDAPGELGFAGKFAKVRNTVTLSVEQTETAEASTWALNGAHYLEAWGDLRAADGTLSVVQPMIAPLYSKAEDSSGPAVPVFSELEFLAFLGGEAKPEGYSLVRATWRGVLGGDFEKQWARTLHDGRSPVAGAPESAPVLELGRVVEAVSGFAPAGGPSRESLEVVFDVGFVGDGRFANNPWLQELPHAATRVCWDNPALMSPKTAAALGLSPRYFKESDPSRIYTKEQYPKARIAEIAIGERKAKCAVWICPGMADDTVIVMLGYGRRHCGLVGNGVGFDVNGLRDASGSRVARGARAADAREDWYEVSSTQNHWSLEGRTEIVRQVDLAAWRKHGDEVEVMKDSIYGRTKHPVNFAEMLGELSHTPPNVSIYSNPFNAGPQDPDQRAVPPTYKNFRRENKPDYASRPQYGMTIDLSTCTGCGACTVACQAENNIPVAGKIEVAKGREMQWIRVDRYYVGDDVNEPEEMLHQPVACVHCENAPCETVCPVNATVHGPEGINYQVYNRCIGTRYCANNCPYKVRRFNFFEFGISKFNGEYYGEKTIDSLTLGRLKNINLIPPRLRKKVDEISRMQRNPDVTVRMRGVMEKCTYCIQRINAARVETKLQGMTNIPDGFFQAACEQACPSNAITFGDILDEASRVSRERASGRSYLLLGYLNTRPRTSYLLRVRNPNPKLREPVADPPGLHHHHHDHSRRGGAGPVAFYDRRKRREDGGYAMSLSVLGVRA